MRAFVQLREMIVSNKGLARRLNELEKKYDAQFRIVIESIRELMAEPEPKVRRIGFKVNCWTPSIPPAPTSPAGQTCKP